MMRARRAVRGGALVCWVASMLCVGCVAGEVPGGHSADDSALGQAGVGGPSPPSFAEVYEVMERTCGGGMSGCHITGMSAGLAMPDVEAAHTSLVNVASPKCEGAVRVVPGDADASLLLQVLDGSSTCVKPMPLGRDTWSEDDIELVRAWIEEGALP
jgi:hypothetical protein